MKTTTRYDVFCGIFLAVALMFLWWRVRYGGLIADESLTWVQTGRFLNGDLPFRHEWNLSLLSGFFLVPVHWLMRLLGLSTDGFLLFTRRFFVLVWIGYITFIYGRWRKVDALGALMGSVLLVLLPPRYVFSFSYNSISFMGVLFALTLYCTNRNKSVSMDLICGISLAVGVIGCPYIAAFYPIYFIWGVIKEWRRALAITAGCAIVAIVFLYYLFANIPYGDFAAALPFLLQPNPDYTNNGLLNIPSYTIKVMASTFGGWPYFLVYLAVMSYAMIYQRRRHGKTTCLSILLPTGAIIGLFIRYVVVEGYNSLNTLAFIVPIFAISLVFLLGDTKEKTLLRTFIVSGAYAIAYNAASNTGRLAFSTAIGVAIVPSCVYLSLLLRRMKFEMPAGVYQCLITSVGAVVLSHLICEFIVAPIRGFPDVARRAAQGPLGGLYVDDRVMVEYESICQDCQVIDGIPGDWVLFLGRYAQWEYLSVKKRIAGYSAWLGKSGNYVFERLTHYWEINPDRWPDVIYVKKQELNAFYSFLEALESQRGYKPMVLNSGNIIYRKMLLN